MGLSKQITEKLLHPSNQPSLSTLVSLPAYTKEQEFPVTDIIKASKELTKRGVKKISSQQVKAMLHGNLQTDGQEDLQTY